MKARIINKGNARVPKKIIEDEQYAREFWEQLKESVPDGNYGKSFNEWYDKIRTLDFYYKVVDIQDSVARKKAGD